MHPRAVGCGTDPYPRIRDALMQVARLPGQHDMLQQDAHMDQHEMDGTKTKKH